jgi:hypothetical protein
MSELPGIRGQKKLPSRIGSASDDTEKKAAVLKAES